MNLVLKSGLCFALAGFVSTANAQLISSLTPNSGSIGQTVDVLIRGVNTHFQNNVSHADFGQGILVQNLRVSNPLTATATISITNAASTGFRDVSIVTGAEVATSMSGFEVFTVGANFKANIILIPVETISLSNIDLTKPANTPILFFANIYNDNTVRYISIEVALSSGSRGHIGSIIASPRRINPNDFLRLTNREFSDVDINGPSGQEFLNIVKSTGSFPPDNYTYKLIIKDNDGTILATDEGVNVVTNINYNPELIWPGADFTAHLETVSTPFPVFQWFGQMDKYDFSLYELREGQTPQEAIRNIAVFQQKNISATNFVYPAYA